LPDPELYTEAQLIRMFSGSLRGSGNYVYRAAPVRPEHFTIDYGTHEIVLTRPSTVGVEHFFMWYIMQV